MIRLLVLGDLNLDIHAEEPSPTAPGQETRAAVRVVPGGSAGTFARTAAELGAWVRFLGAVGRDAAGDLLARDLASAGVRAHLKRIDLPTGAVLALHRAGDRSMICARGANEGLDETDVSPALLRRIHHVHIAGYAFLSAPQARAARRAIQLARAAGASVSVNAPPASLLKASGVDEFVADVRAVDILIVNRDEGRCLTGASDDAAIVVALAARHAAGALTLGADGALAWCGTERCAAQPPTRLDVDPTGAGDVFAATFVVRRLAGSRLETASREACSRAHAHLAARDA